MFDALWHLFGEATGVGAQRLWLGPPVAPFYPSFWGGSPAKLDYRKKGTLILSSLLEDLVEDFSQLSRFRSWAFLRSHKKPPGLVVPNRDEPARKN